MTLGNGGFTPASGVTATFTSLDPLITSIPDATCSFDAVPARGQAISADPITVVIDPGTPVPSNLDGNLKVTDAAGSQWILPVSLRVSTTHQLAGSVLLDGVPLAGATVSYEGQWNGQTETAGDGGFQLSVPIGTYALSASYQGDPLTQTEVQSFTTPGDQTGITFALTTATIAGQVIDQKTAAPVPGATINLFGPRTETMVSEADGTFSLTQIHGRTTTWQVVAQLSPQYRFPSAAQTVAVPPDANGITLRLGEPTLGVDLDGALGFDLALASSGIASRSFTIQNTGVANLEWQLTRIAADATSDTRGNILNEFPAPAGLNVRPQGAAFDGTDLFWYLNGFLYRQDPATGAELESRYLPDIVVGAKDDWRLAFHDGVHFWFEELVPDPDDIRHAFIDLHRVDLIRNLIIESVEIDREIHVSVDYGPITRNNEGETWGNARAGAFAEGVFWFYKARADAAEGKRRSNIARVDRYTGDLISEFRLPEAVNYPVLDFTNDPMDLFDFTDFTYASGALWVIQSNESNLTRKRIYKIDPDTGATIRSFVASPNPGQVDFREVVADATGALFLFDDKTANKRVLQIDSGDRLWMTANAGSGRVAEGESFDLELTFDASIVSDGLYHGAIHLATSDASQPALIFPVIFAVGDPVPGNQPPTLTLLDPTPDPFAGPLMLHEGDAQQFLTSQNDPDGDALIRDWALDGIRVSGAKNWTYQTGFFDAGPHAIAVSVSDGRGGIDTHMWWLVVANVNRPPVAEDATYTVANSDPLDFHLEASDPDEEALDWTILTTPAHGTLEGTPPDLLYQPNPGYVGADSFTFEVSDGDLTSAPATITLQVGFRDLIGAATPIDATVAFGQTVTQALTIQNGGNTPLQYAVAMVPDDPAPSAGTLTETIGPLPIPTDGNFATNLEGLAFDGTHLISSLLEQKGPNNADPYRSHILFYDPDTGAMVGDPLPAPTDTDNDKMWVEHLTWSGSSIWAVNYGFTTISGGLETRMFELGIETDALTRLNYLVQFPSDFGGYNTGLAFDHESLWMLVTPTSTQDDPRGIFRIQPGTKEIERRLEIPPYDTSGNQFGPIAFWNGAIWWMDQSNRPMQKRNPFTSEVLQEIPLQTNLRWHAMAPDLQGGFFAKVGAARETLGESLVYRLQSGDYARMTPSSGTLQGGESIVIDIEFDSLVAGPGIHTGEILLFSDDPDEPEMSIPYTLQVDPAPGNDSPVVDSFTPGSNIQSPARERLWFSVTASDPNADSLAYRWYVDGVRQLSAENQSTFTMVTPLSNETLDVRVEIDDSGGGLTSQTWTVEPTQPALSVEAMASPDRGLPPLDVELRAHLSGGHATDGILAGSPGMIVVEAEDYDRTNDSESSLTDGYWLEAESGFGPGVRMFAAFIFARHELDWDDRMFMEYDIQFPEAGEYELWMRVQNAGDDGNSCDVGMNGFQVGGEFDDQNGASTSLRWVKHGTSFNIEAGMQTFRISASEAYYQVDRFIFTRDSGYVPTGDGPISHNHRLPAATFSWNPDDGNPLADGIRIMHHYGSPGVYEPMVIAYAAEGSASDDTLVILERTYDYWASQRLTGRPAADLLKTANPDGDAFSNLMEFALGLDPLEADSGEVLRQDEVEEEGQTYFAIEYTRPLDRHGLQMEVEVSDTLDEWRSNADGLPVTSTRPIARHEDGTETVQTRDLTPMEHMERRFMRLRVLENPE